MLNYLSKISTARNINLTSKNHKIQFFSLFASSFLNFAFKTDGTLKVLILGAQDSFHIILSYYVGGHLKKTSNLNFISSIDFQVSKILILFGNIYCVASFETIFWQI